MANALIDLLGDISGMAERAVEVAEAKAAQDAKDKAFEDYCYRRLARFKQWAMKQDKEVLAEHLSMAALLLIEKRRTERLQLQAEQYKEKVIGYLTENSSIAEAREAAAREVAKDYMGRLIASKADRQRGAASTNAAKQAAKERTRELWDKVPEDEKVRRGAVLRFATVTAPKVEGTTVDGIRRWLADWRKESSSR